MKNTKTNNQNQTNQHFPVLPDAVLHYLQPKKGESYLDLTAGYGGHAEALLERTLQPGTSTLVDRDHHAIAYLHDKFAGSGIQIIHQDFLGASQELIQANKQFDLILADLGVSSPHLDNAGRGFSLRTEGPLDMRMDQTQSLTAEVIVNDYDEAELSYLIHEYGEEPRARKIARLIVEHRPITTTTSLAKVVAQAWPGHSKVHPATRTFQALRIAVNSELDQIKQAIPLWVDLLAPGGRIVVISFHSLEDRIVKQQFKELAGNRYDAVLTLLTKQPVMADDDEIVSNPRARSAKLRAAAKQKQRPL
ncbi:MAG TPA: 16S rRNA (cytosine(1402)-N(4))-methyltransferase RsmH [Candidatus Limnocylindria bacterium]|nr:16S rRNA (cytosine(1402)-N(4))-methyltransferase RsmH [Candidatus Limnocylindria bacterium]